MRRVLNLLQATHLSYESVDESVVYLTAGAAVPAVIDSLLTSLMNDTFRVAYDTVMNSIVEYGYALCDIVTVISVKLLQIGFPDAVLSYLLDHLSTLEFRLSHGCNERLQVGAFVGTFTVARAMIINKPL